MSIESSQPLSTLSVREIHFFLFSPVYLILIEITHKGIYQLNSNETETHNIHFYFNFY